MTTETQPRNRELSIIRNPETPLLNTIAPAEGSFTTWSLKEMINGIVYRAFTQNSAEVINLMGDVGIGKTTLAGEILMWLTQTLTEKSISPEEIQQRVKYVGFEASQKNVPKRDEDEHSWLTFSHYMHANYNHEAAILANTRPGSIVIQESPGFGGRGSIAIMDLGLHKVNDPTSAGYTDSYILITGDEDIVNPSTHIRRQYSRYPEHRYEILETSGTRVHLSNTASRITGGDIQALIRYWSNIDELFSFPTPLERAKWLETEFAPTFFFNLLEVPIEQVFVGRNTRVPLRHLYQNMLDRYTGQPNPNK